MKIITDLKEANELLQSYRSAKLEIMIYSPSLGRLALQATLPNVEKVVYIVGVSCKSIYGSFKSMNVDLKIHEELNEFGETISTLSERTDQFKLVTSSGFVLAFGLESEFGSSFDDFIKEK